MTAETWEARMSRRAAERERAAPSPDLGQPCEIGDPDLPAGHQGHHVHQVGWGTQCSCGAVIGVCCYVLPDWTEEEWDQWLDEHRCPICGEPGVISQ